MIKMTRACSIIETLRTLLQTTRQSLLHIGHYPQRAQPGNLHHLRPSLPPQHCALQRSDCLVLNNAGLSTLWRLELASNPSLPRSFFSQPWKKSLEKRFFPRLRKKLRGKPGFEARLGPYYSYVHTVSSY